MIAELGHFALAMALAIGVLLTLVPLLGAQRGNVLWMSLARPAARAQFLFVALAFAALAHAFIDNDFSLAYVAQNSNSALPLAYRISALWGAHEGSLLLWVLLLCAWSCAVSFGSRGLPLAFSARVLSVMGGISVGFLLFMLATSNPFLRQLPPPTDGADLNPLLQDFGLVVHPPMLYTGYVGFSVAFAFAIAGLIGGHLDSAWARWARPWTLLAWTFLTLGIALGSWWAYYELGWGGWWFWDPVENASFMPWLLGTALIHSLAATEKRDVFKSWTVLLAIGAFGLSLLGTFLVRSGVLTSVHAFASDPARGVFILVFLVLVIGGALALYAWRGTSMLSGASYALTSRESFLLANSVLLTVSCATVLLGTLYPLVLDALGLGKISVGPPYFNAVFVPLMAPLVVLLGLGQHARWKQDRFAELCRGLRLPLLGTLVLLATAVATLSEARSPRAVFGLALALWVLASSVGGVLRRCRARSAPWAAFMGLPAAYLGQHLAHLGFAVTIVGVTLVSLDTVDVHARAAPGDSVTAGDYVFTFAAATPIEGPNYDGTAARFEVTRDGEHVTTLSAEKRNYRVRGMPMTEAGIAPGLRRDLYVSLGEPLDDKAWSVRVSVKPFVRWLWLGAMLMAAGGVVAMCDPRFRRLATRRAARAATGGAVTG
ncbi:MAG: heme lyase CcmF/NrfE family subunit [Gammaproteobacteria bacterium]